MTSDNATITQIRVLFMFEMTGGYLLLLLGLVSSISYLSDWPGKISKMTYLPTVLARQVMQLPPYVCPSICFHFIFWTEWPLALIFCMCVGHYHGLQGLKLKVTGQGQGSTLSVW